MLDIIYHELPPEDQRTVVERFLAMDKKQRRSAKQQFIAGLLRNPNDRRPRRCIMADAHRVWDKVHTEIRAEFRKQQGVK